MSILSQVGIIQHLKTLTNEELIGIGTSLGLRYTTLKKMKSDSLLHGMVHAWLRKDDEVTEVSGEPSWESLVIALKVNGLNRLAFDISRAKLTTALPSLLTQRDHLLITQHLMSLTNNELVNVGVRLGLHYSTIKKMSPGTLLDNMVHAWLRRDDYSGDPSWESLTNALEDCGMYGIASEIKRAEMPIDIPSIPTKSTSHYTSFPLHNQPEAMKADEAKQQKVVRPPMHLVALPQTQDPESLIGTFSKVKSNTATFSLDMEGATIKLDDIEIIVPPMAVPQKKVVHAMVGVATYGPFTFADNCQPVSPILWFCIEETITFDLPVTFKIPHVIMNPAGASLSFAKADHSSKITFNKIKDRDATFVPGKKPYGILTSIHRCFLCIQAESHYEHKFKEPFQFTANAQPCLETSYSSTNELEFINEKGNKITASKVDFWTKYDDNDMKLMHKEKMYPPHISTVVHSKTNQWATLILRIQGIQIDGATDAFFQVAKQFGNPSSSSSESAAASSQSTASQTYEMKDLNFLYKTLCKSVCPKWQHFSSFLDIDPSVVDRIESEKNDDVQLCFREVLKEWLKQIDPLPTKVRMIQALQDSGFSHEAKLLATTEAFAPSSS